MLHDLRYALRQLRKSPGFTLTAVLTLAVGIGGVTAVFSVVYAVLLRPLPFHDPSRLVRLHEGIVHQFASADLPAPDVISFERDNHAFSGIAGFTNAAYELTGAGTPLQTHAERVSASLFPVLGVHPLLGRTFTAREDENSAPVVVISYALWRERFQSSPSVLGHTIDLDRRPYTIIGVMPRSFEFPLDPGHLTRRDLWVPMSFTPTEKQDETDNFQYGAVARLKPGMTLAQAQSDLDRMVAALQAQIPAKYGIELSGKVTSLREDTVCGVQPLLRVLLAAACLILLIACVNLANLLLVRAAGRRREFGVRLALGAARRTVIRQLLTESALLSLVGGLIAVVCTLVLVRAAPAFLPDSLPSVGEIAVHWPVLLIAAALVLVTSVVCGLAPALASAGAEPLNALRDGGQAAGQSRSQHRLRNALVIAETALAMLLLVGAGLLLRSFTRMLETDPGFQPSRVLTADLVLPQADYPTQNKVNQFYTELTARLARLPGVKAAAASSNVPLVGINSDRSFVPKGYVSVGGKRWAATSNYYVLGDYFSAMRISLLRGRYLSAQDDQPNAPLTAVISQTLANQYWPHQDPIGRQFTFGGNPTSKFPAATVVGVVADIRQGRLDQAVYPQMYEPLTQADRQFGPMTEEITGGKPRGNMHIVVRTTSDPAALAGSLRKTVHQLDPLLAVTGVRTMDAVVSATEAPRRFNTAVLTAFAGIALLLALLGIYGVLAYTVTERTREIAIRMALGSTREAILRRTVRSAVVLAGFGVIIGVAASIGLTRYLSSLLYGTRPLDAVTFAGAIVVLLLCAAVAGWLPARRAASVDPMQTLRSE